MENTYFIGVIISNFEGELTMENLGRALEMEPAKLAKVIESDQDLKRKFDERSKKLSEIQQRARSLRGDGEFMKPRRGFGDRCDRLLMNRQIVRRQAQR